MDTCSVRNWSEMDQDLETLLMNGEGKMRSSNQSWHLGPCGLEGEGTGSVERATSGNCLHQNTRHKCRTAWKEMQCSTYSYFKMFGLSVLQINAASLCLRRKYFANSKEMKCELLRTEPKTFGIDIYRHTTPHSHTPVLWTSHCLAWQSN